jgi:TatD DNase family protein
MEKINYLSIGAKSMRLFDSHCHLDDASYESDMEKVVKRMDQAGVEAAMIVGVDQERSERAVALAVAGKGFYASVGVHPHDAAACSESTLTALRNLAKSPEVKAWGETGLDFNRMFSPRKEQEKWFIRQIQVADELQLPLIYHERDSNGRFAEIVKEYETAAANGVVHCFSGNRKELETYIDLGLHIGITGIITLKSRGRELREMVPLIPEEKILIETDAPYLTPTPERNRFKRNEPSFVKSVLLKLAQVRQQDPSELAEVIWNNTCRLYRIGGYGNNTDLG